MPSDEPDDVFVPLLSLALGPCVLVMLSDVVLGVLLLVALPVGAAADVLPVGVVW